MLRLGSFRTHRSLNQLRLSRGCFYFGGAGRIYTSTAISERSPSASLFYGEAASESFATAPYDDVGVNVGAAQQICTAIAEVQARSPSVGRERR